MGPHCVLLEKNARQMLRLSRSAAGLKSLFSPKIVSPFEQNPVQNGSPFTRFTRWRGSPTRKRCGAARHPQMASPSDDRRSTSQPERVSEAVAKASPADRVIQQ